MTDNNISKYTGSQNSFFAKLLNDPNTTGTYINRSTWKEELINNEYQYDEYQEEEYNNENYSNFIEERSSIEAIYDLMNGSIYSNVSVKLDSLTKDRLFENKINKKFTILREFDVINNLYLEIDLGDNFEEISIEEKYYILNSEIRFIIGGSQFDKLKLITCIINQICSGNNIKEDNNIVQIPLYNFDTCIDKKYNIKGLPIVALAFHEVSIELIINNKIKHFNYKLIVNGLVYDSKERKHLYLSKSNDHILLQNQHDNNPILNNNKYKLYFNHIVKYIMIYFMPTEDINFWQMTENYPLINKASLHINNSDLLEFENEDLLDFEIFGIKVYMLPLCKEFSDFKNIYETFKNPLKLLSSNGINFSRIDKSYLEIDLENKSDMYEINYIGVNFNCMQISGGLCNLRYTN